jgi:predicted TPR repeat methyltransferase/lipoprotein NlpI
MTSVSPAQALRHAIQYHQAGRLAEARQIYEQILSGEPRNAQALHLLGLVAHQSGDAAVAETMIRNAIALQPNDPDFHSNLGEILRAMGRIDEALEILQSAAARFVQSPAIHHNLGIALKDKGRLAEAIASLRIALQLQPQNAAAHHHLAAALAFTGQHAAAISEFRQAIALQPNSPSAYNNLANTLLEVHQLDEAIAAFGSALALKPDFAEAHNNLGTAYWRRDRREDALHSFRRALALNSRLVSAAINLSGALLATGLFEEALAVATNALENAPHDPQLHRSRALALVKLNRINEAREAYESAIAVNPDSELYRFELAAITAGETTRSMPASYARMIFDDYAADFDRHLVGALEYRVPEFFLEDVLALPGERQRSTRDILDLGCGTGLCALHFRPFATRITGVDFAPKMIEAARARRVYDELILGDMMPVLHERPGSFDLILAGDLFLYVGELDALFHAVAAALRPFGLFACSIESSDGQDVLLRPTRRFAHSLDYVRRLARQTGLLERSAREVILRKDGGVPIPGWIVLLQKGASASQPDSSLHG